MSTRIKQWFVKAFLRLVEFGASVVRVAAFVGRAFGRPMTGAWKFCVRWIGVPLYRLVFLVRRAVGRLHIPHRQRIVFWLSNRYAIHGVILVVVFATSAMNAQAGTLRAESFGQRSMLYRMATGQDRESVQVVRADAVSGKPTRYLGSTAVSIQPNIDFHSPDDDYVGLSSAGAAVIAQTISEAIESTAPRTETLEYTVVEGDTMSTIAQRHGISLTTLLWANDLSVRSVIRPGDALRILPVDGLEHTVRAGDTVLALARKYDANATKIVEANRLADAGDLSIGEVLLIPGGTRPIVAPSPSRSLARVFSAPAPSAIATASGKMIWPTDLRAITQYFGWRHTGLDIDCQFTNSNYVADDGIVQFAGWKGGYGITVEVNHGNGIVTRYGHAARNYVSAGESVTKGQAIQLCGTTGRSTGTHLHFEVIIGGAFKNPLSYIR